MLGKPSGSRGSNPDSGPQTPSWWEGSSMPQIKNTTLHSRHRYLYSKILGTPLPARLCFHSRGGDAHATLKRCYYTTSLILVKFLTSSFTTTSFHEIHEIFRRLFTTVSLKNSETINYRESNR